MNDMAGIHRSVNALIIATVGRPKPPTKRKHPIKMLESQERYSALSWVIFGSGLELALRVNQV
jgi:hypothetical protein